MQDFFKQQSEWLNTWQEQQQELTKQYASWGEDLTQGFQGATKQQIPTNFEDLLKSQQELFEQFTSFGTNLQQNIQQTWGDKLPEELLRQFNFNLLQEFYKSWLGNIPRWSAKPVYGRAELGRSEQFPEQLHQTGTSIFLNLQQLQPD
jgi:hypothetical protein